MATVLPLDEHSCSRLPLVSDEALKEGNQVCLGMETEERLGAGDYET